MNRCCDAHTSACIYFPRASGDEPMGYWWLTLRWPIFPARVGMNRRRSGIRSMVWHFPRASGDEPAMSRKWEKLAKFSPREWG